MNTLTEKEINEKVMKLLVGFSADISPYFDDFFSKQKDFARTISPEALDMVERYEKFMGGKSLRGALTKLGYEMFVGKPNTDIYKAAAVVDIIHAFALIHDDYMDNDELRRGKPTMHVQYQGLHENKFSSFGKDKQMYANSMAVLVGDLGLFLANLLVSETSFSSEKKVLFIKKVSEILLRTVYGQGMDVTYDQYEFPNEEFVMRIHRNKTSYYTIVGPLQYGAILAGVEENDARLKAIEEYGVSVGIAFQLRDDELGMFSKQEKFGKPIYSDLRQGKNTILFAKAFEKANSQQLDFLKATHGNPDVKEEDLHKVNEILEETGAVAYSKQLAEKLLKKGKSAIPDITDDTEMQNLLTSIADFSIMRDK